MRAFILAALFPLYVQAHLTAWTKGMYCLNGTSGFNNENNDEPVAPLFQLPKLQWWMHHVNKCDEFPPAPGDFLEIPANGRFTVEVASNRAFTSFSYGGRYVSQWGDGADHPDDYSIFNLGGQPNPGRSDCIPSPNLHAKSEATAAGTAFAISYHSKLSDVTLENLVVFTVKYHTPFKQHVTYDAPNLPPCPPGGCICVWGWIPNHCGQSNMYMMPHRCMVTGKPGSVQLDRPKAPIWCEGNPSACVTGPKQFIAWNQLEGNNVITEGYQGDGDLKSPGYNQKMGFANGAQNDIFKPANNLATTKSTSTRLVFTPKPTMTITAFDVNSSSMRECIDAKALAYLHNRNSRRQARHRLDSIH